MESIIQTFHIDWKLIIAQMVNFGIVVAVLWFFALKPLVQKMRERQTTIEKSLDEAKQISEKFKKAQDQKNTIIFEARFEAQKIIEQSKKFSQEERQKSVTEAKIQVERLVHEGKALLAQEKEKLFEEVKKESADLIVLAASKVLKTSIDKKIDDSLIHKALKELRSKT